ncbi:MAG: YbaB/EbfC family nucleoid-associated protein [Candidatus Blackburnbacteria bacterium]|nr:YbaB/EbfC family nucleoid-associated protein [Candidatus Blackburnbacteria bacterium]
MFDKFKQGAGMIKMANRLRQVQNELSRERITIEENGIKVVVTGDMKIRELEVDGEEQGKVVDVVNKAVKKAQEVSAKKMQEMGGLKELFGG